MKRIPLLLLFILGNGLVWSQTRLNTDKLEAKVQQELNSSEKNLRELEREAKKLNDQIRRGETEAGKTKRQLEQIEREIVRVRKLKIDLFRSIIASLMNDPEVGYLFREKPNRIFLVQWIEDTILKEPWLLEPIEEILNTYR